MTSMTHWQKHTLFIICNQQQLTKWWFLFALSPSMSSQSPTGKVCACPRESTVILRVWSICSTLPSYLLKNSSLKFWMEAERKLNNWARGFNLLSQRRCSMITPRKVKTLKLFTGKSKFSFKLTCLELILRIRKAWSSLFSQRELIKIGRTSLNVEWSFRSQSTTKIKGWIECS